MKESHHLMCKTNSSSLQDFPKFESHEALASPGFIRCSLKFIHPRSYSIGKDLLCCPHKGHN